MDLPPGLRLSVEERPSPLDREFVNNALGWVDTFSFQAPGFYRKLGYRKFGRIDYPPDHQRLFLQKQLVAG